MSATYNVIGQAVPRIDAALKVTGDLPFFDDIHLPGMLYGRILHSPYAHVKITAIDTSAAEALTGVMAVVTNKDSSTVPYSTVFNNYTLDTEVRFVGDEVAAVAAVDPYIAEDALALIKVTYQQLPFLIGDANARAAGATQLYPTETGNIVGGKPMTLNFGNAATAFSKSDDTLQGTFSTQIQNHVRANLGGCLADWSTPDKLTVYVGTQDAHGQAATLSKLFGISRDQIEVVGTICGGTFGSSNSGRSMEIACLLSRKSGRPVRVQYTRGEDFMASTHRRPMSFNVKIGFMNTGTLTAIDYTLYANVGATGGTGPTGMNRMNAYDFVRWTDGNWTGYATYTNEPLSGAFRGYGGPQNYFAVGTLLDQAAEKLGMDPVAFLKLNAVKTGDPQPSTNTAGKLSVVCPINYAGCLDMGASLIGWSTKWHKAGQGPVTGTKKHGIGVSLGLHECYPLGTYNAVVQVKVNGTAVVYAGNSDIGQGHRTAMAQIAAEALGMNYQDVYVCNADSSLTQYTPTTSATAACLSGGNAVAQAAMSAQQQMFAFAATALKAPVTDISAAKGKVFQTSNPTNSMTLASLMSGIGNVAITGTWAGAVTRYPVDQRAIGVHFAEVNVDTATGLVDILNSVSVWDSGKSINPNLVNGNLISGSVQGHGYGLTEEGVIDQATGRVLNSNYYQYGIFTTADDAFPVAGFVETPQTQAPYGQKGVGEVGHVSPAAAIANAVYDAVAIRFTSLPITPAKILQALGKA